MINENTRTIGITPTRFLVDQITGLRLEVFFFRVVGKPAVEIENLLWFKCAQQQRV